MDTNPTSGRLGSMKPNQQTAPAPASWWSAEQERNRLRALSDRPAPKPA